MSDACTKIPLNKGTQTEKPDAPARITDGQERSLLDERIKLDELRCNLTAPLSTKGTSSDDIYSDSQYLGLEEIKEVSLSTVRERGEQITPDLLFEEAEPAAHFDPSLFGFTLNNKSIEKLIRIDMLTEIMGIFENLSSKPNRKNATLTLVRAVSDLQEKLDQAAKHGAASSSRTS